MKLLGIENHRLWRRTDKIGKKERERESVNIEKISDRENYLREVKWDR